MQAATPGAARHLQQTACRPAPIRRRSSSASILGPAACLATRPVFDLKRSRARARLEVRTTARPAGASRPRAPDEVRVAGGDGAAEHFGRSRRVNGGDLLDGQELPRKIVERLHGTSPASARSERAHESFSVGLPSLCCVLKVQAAVASNKVSSDRPMPLSTAQRGLRIKWCKHR